MSRKYLVAPDSFKGSMTSEEVCDLMAAAIREEDPGAEVLKFPVADGGEGFLNAFLRACGGTRYEEEVAGPLFRPVRAEWAMLGDGSTAVVEMASAAGILLLSPEERNPEKTTTQGVGELILRAVDKGAKKIILGLGGSATNDGGIGMAHALGFRFLDEDGRELRPVGASLGQIRKIVTPVPGKIPAEVAFEAACDVQNPIAGKKGAAYIFAPQKGADASMVMRLDAGLSRLSRQIREDLGIDAEALPGGGAAGGLGAGAAAFLGAELRSGIDLLLEAAGFDKLARQADYVFTGEGRMDGQSLSGKAPVGIARRAASFGIPVIGIAGSLGDDPEALFENGFTAVFSTIRGPGTWDEIRATCRRDLQMTVRSAVRLIR